MKPTIRRYALHAVLWPLGALLVFVAVNLKDPHLLAVRAWELPLLVGVSLAGIALFAARFDGAPRVLGMGLFMLALGTALVGEWGYRQRQAEVLAQGAHLAGLGRHVIAGYADPAQLRPLIEQGLIGGVFLTRRNTAGKTLEQLREEIATMQRWRADAGRAPLWVAADQEGGIVAGLSPPLPRHAPLGSLLAQAATDAEHQRQAHALGSVQGRDLAMLGVNLNFSPVVDLKLARPDDPLDLHSRIGERAISADPAITTAMAGAYLDGLASQGVRGTLKHFPGLGRVHGDTHHFAADLEVPLDLLQAQDWQPFRELATSREALIMLGHVRLPALDARYPASFSKALVGGVIRQQWAHDGLLITDDLTMAAAYRHGLCTAAVGALEAGVDLLLVSWDYQKVFEVLHCLSQAGPLDALADSARRLSAAGH